MVVVKPLHAETGTLHIVGSPNMVFLDTQLASCHASGYQR